MSKLPTKVYPKFVGVADFIPPRPWSAPLAPRRMPVASEARRKIHLALVRLAIERLHEYYVFWDGFGSLAAKTRGLIEHDRVLNCEHRSPK